MEILKEIAGDYEGFAYKIKETEDCFLCYVDTNGETYYEDEIDVEITHKKQNIIGFDTNHSGDTKEKKNLEYCINKVKEIITHIVAIELERLDKEFF